MPSGDREAEHVEPRDVRERLRQEPHLDIPGHAHLVLEPSARRRLVLDASAHVLVHVGQRAHGERQHSINGDHHERQPNLIEYDERIDEKRKAAPEHTAPEERRHR